MQAAKANVMEFSKVGGYGKAKGRLSGWVGLACQAGLVGR
jgi:hypothetical protein